MLNKKDMLSRKDEKVGMTKKSAEILEGLMAEYDMDLSEILDVMINRYDPEDSNGEFVQHIRQHYKKCL